MNSYGECLQLGFGTQIDSSQAAGWFKRSAELGSATGQTLYADCLRYSWGVDPDIRAAAVLYKKSADQGSATGLLNLAFQQLAHSQDGTASLKASAVRGNLAAIRALAYHGFRADNAGVDLVAAEAYTYAVGSSLELSDECIPTLIPGERQTSVEMGDAFTLGRGTKIDRPRAAALYKQASEQGDRVGQFRWADCLQSGTGVRADPAAAARIYKTLADTGDSVAILKWADCLEHGKGVQQNPAEAVLWYKLAASLGSAMGLVGYGRCLRNGIGVRRDEAAAMACFKKAADGGSAVGNFELAKFLADAGGEYSQEALIRERIAASVAAKTQGRNN
jgi:TPR repeat protein